jgi:tight adherence protein C
VGADVLLAPGAGLRRLLGGRADPRLDRRAGAALLVATGAWLVGPVPALTAAAAGLVAARWRALRRTRRTTADDVARDLPDVVDLLTLAVGAGLSVPAAIPAIAPLSPPAVRDGLLAASDALAGGRASDAVVLELGRRWGPPARPLVHALADHLRYGTPVLPPLERVGAEARAARRRAAEAGARRLPVLLLFPLVLCTLPAFGVLTVAPLVAGTFDSLRGGHLEAPASIAPP